MEVPKSETSFTAPISFEGDLDPILGRIRINLKFGADPLFLSRAQIRELYRTMVENGPTISDDPAARSIHEVNILQIPIEATSDGLPSLSPVLGMKEAS
jgi:hypothetical protein